MKLSKSISVILLCIILITSALIAPVPVYAESYAPCQICHGTAKCGLCDPALVPEGMGNGYLHCHYCDGTGMRTCGTNTTGDGRRIGCDGSGYDSDGSVCEVCGGAGKYLCDACGGAKQFECKCREAGMPGKCHICFGTGWRTVDSQGKGINTSPVWPPDGATIDFGVNGRHEVYTYSASRFGSGVTPAQAMAAVGASSQYDFQQALRAAAAGGGQSQGSGASSGSGASQGSQQGQTQAPDEVPAPGPETPLDENIPEDPYMTEDLTGEEIIRQIQADDDIYLFRGLAGGGYRMSVRIVRSALDAETLAKVRALTETEIDQLKTQIEAAAKGFSFGPSDAFDMVSTDGRSLLFGFEAPVDLPCVSDLVIQLPELDLAQPHHVYRVDGAAVTEVGTPPDLDEYGGVKYLVVSTARLSAFAYTDIEPIPREPAETQISETAETQAPETADPAAAPVQPQPQDAENAPQGQNIGVQSNHGATSEAKPLGVTALIILAAAAAGIAAGVLIAVLSGRKRKGGRGRR